MTWRILYVDDEADLREVAQMSLELDADFQVRCAASGEDALKEVHAWQPHLVLLDVMMPAMDGPQTLQRIKDFELSREPLIVFITARASDQDRIRLKDLGAAGVIAKPFDPMRLASDVRGYLSDSMPTA